MTYSANHYHYRENPTNTSRLTKIIAGCYNYMYKRNIILKPTSSMYSSSLYKQPPNLVNLKKYVLNLDLLDSSNMKIIDLCQQFQ